MMRTAPAALFLCLLTACARDSARPAFPSGPALQGPIRFEFALFYPDAPREEPQTALDALLASDFSGITRADKLPDKGDQRLISTTWVTDGSYAAPDVEGLSYFGRGLSDAQAAALQQPKAVLLLDFGHGKEHVWTGARDALRLTSALARRTGGIIWDNESHEMFTPDVWDEKRIATWTEADGPTDLRNQFTIHVYRKEEDGLHREVSLGLRKFGLPDFVVEDVSGSVTSNMVGVVNVLAQLLAEGAQVGGDGEIDIDVQGLRIAEMRKEKVASYKSNATGKARLRLVLGVPQEGDPENRLAEIVFDRYSGPDTQARQEVMLSTLFGADEDTLTNTTHGEEVLEVSRKARETLLATLKPAFQKGLPPGETLLVKAPFKTPAGGNEWMWVEVLEWKTGTIQGTLRNDPVEVKALKAGQRVEVQEKDLFDYIHYLADGSSEGNETAKLLSAGG
ncbi:MAG TPA: DUF2314 domain-containing protein [Thermoanaerobaculia bacterium]|jgi:uncharacterized protein YegJ (DUF2314 family)|nr:DUF2314 domain-containing protein [Thermoanaerobaculia bacterium]